MPVKRIIINNSLFIGITSTFFLLQATHWPPLFYWGWWGGGNFLDSWLVLKAVDCYNSIGLDIYHLNNPCVTYAYGRPLIWVLKLFHLGASQSSAFGVAFLVILAYVISSLVKTLELSRVNKILVAAGIIFSPPILLLGDRGNFDSLCLSGLLLAAWLFKRGNSKSGVTVIFVISIFKYYVLPILIIIPFLTKSKLNRMISLGLFVIAGFSVSRDLSITEFDFSPETPHLTFGMGNEFLYFGRFNKLNWMQDLSQYLGLAVTCVLIAISYLVLKKNKIEIRAYNQNSSLLMQFLLSTLTLEICYFSGFNADYRLIFFVVSALSLIQLNLNQMLNKYIYVLVISILWLTFPSGELEIFGDFALSIYVSITVAIGIILVTRFPFSTLLDKPFKQNSESSNYKGNT